jgi:hypothetical protein
MTGIPLIDGVLSIFSFIKLLAGIGIGVCLLSLAICVSGFLAPYSRWSLFVDRNITGYGSLFGHNFMWYSGVGLLLCLMVWSVFSWLSSQTLPRFP